MRSEGVRPGPGGSQHGPARGPRGARAGEARAWFRGWQARAVAAYADLRRTPEALASGGWWAVVADFEGPVHAWRFAEARRVPP
jgi:para-aminobenzoate synthetase component 1